MMAIFTAVELFLFLWFFRYVGFMKRIVPRQAIYEVYFAALLVLFSIRAGGLSRLVDRPAFSTFGKYFYSIYMMQFIPQLLLSSGNPLGAGAVMTAFRTGYPVTEIIVCRVMFPVVFGILCYYVLERPTATYFNRKME
jgi:peptidoglycan/LPS O-acetylase OafA/YrhL